MRILKIANGFITNSSSMGADVIIAVKKGQNLKKIFKKLGIHKYVSNCFKEHPEIFEKIKANRESKHKFEIFKINHLIEEYDFLYASFLLGTYGDDSLEVDDDDQFEYDDFNDKTRNLDCEDLIVIYNRSDY